jgi:hypothetical protein
LESQGLLERIGLFYYLQTTGTPPFADLDEGGISLMSLKNMELVPE